MIETTPVRVLSAIDELPDYIAGKAEPEAAKLSSNELPYPPLPEVAAAMTNALLNINRYPTVKAQDLLADLADLYGVNSSWLVAEGGSVVLLGRALQMVATRGKTVIYPWRSFEAYPIMVQVTEARQIRVPLGADGANDLSAMAAAVTEDTAAVIVCTPNNPTGSSVTDRDFRAFMADIPPEVLVILDEAYVEFDDSAHRVDGLALVRDYPNLLDLRTFSKAYGLAGARVGYGIAQPSLIRALGKVTAPFSVSAPSLAGARAALKFRNELAVRVEQIKHEREWIISELRRAGWQVPQSQGNFFWLPAHGFEAEELGQVLQGQAILTRVFPEGVRISIGTPKQNRWLVQVLCELRRG